MQSSVLLSYFLLTLVSSLPLSPKSHSSSESDENPKPPIVFSGVGVVSQQRPEAPPSVIVEVQDVKKNITVSFAIFIIPEEEEGGSGTVGQVREEESNESDDITDDTSNEETMRQAKMPMASLVAVEKDNSSGPMTEGYDSHMIVNDDKNNLSTEKMMNDQPMFTVSEEVDYLKYSTSNGEDVSKNTLSDDLDDSNNSTESRKLNDEPAVSVAGDFDDKNNTKFDDLNDTTSSEESTVSNDSSSSSSAEVVSSSSENEELTDQHNTSTADPTPHDPRILRFNTDHKGALSSDGVHRLGSAPLLQEVSSSSSESSEAAKNSSSVSQEDGRSSREVGLGSSLQKLVSSIQKAIDSLRLTQGTLGRNHHEVLGSTPNFNSSSQMDVSLNSDSDGSLESNSSDSESQESTGSIPSNQVVSSIPDSDESLEAASVSDQNDTPTRLTVQAIAPFLSDFQQGSSLNPLSIISALGQNDTSSDSDSQERLGSSSQIQTGVSSGPVSSEESLQPSRETPTQVPMSRLNSAEVSSSSEEAEVSSSSEEAEVSSSSEEVEPSPKPATKSESSESQSDESHSHEDSDSQGVDSGNDSSRSHGSDSSSESISIQILNPVPVPSSSPDSTSKTSPNSDVNPSIDSTFSSIPSQEDSGSKELTSIEEVTMNANSDVSTDASPTVDYSTNTASITANSETSMRANPEAGIKDVDADSSMEAMTDSDYDVSTEVEPTSSANHPVISINTAASMEATIDPNFAVSMQPTPTIDYRNADSDASIDANVGKVEADGSIEANPEVTVANSPSMTQFPPPPPPPPRRRPFNYGFLGPISHSYNKLPVAREAVSHANYPMYDFNPRHAGGRRVANRNQRISNVKWFEVQAVSDPAQSSSEENK